jgi:poly(A) polymerase
MSGSSNPDRPPRLAGADWLRRPQTQAVFAALAAKGYAARAVGGAVRNALLGEPVKDIDIATTAPPPDVIRLAEAASLKAIPTGVEHGTVTVVANHTPFEVTTLRRDVETFGRHARVAFTDDWADDARRRDFTINAIYCDASGAIHDPLGGLADIEARRVRFIGDPHDRIREDYLRILRFFRFTAEYAQGSPDPAGLKACVELKDGLAQLSGERIRNELLRLLAAPSAVPAIEAMHDAGLLDAVLGQAADPRLLARVAAIEQALGRNPDAILRLGALAASGPGRALALRDRLKLSTTEFERLARMAMTDKAFDPATAEREAKSFIYRHGSEPFFDGAILAWAQSEASAGDRLRMDRAKLAERWTPPALPVRGSDVVALGVPEGPAVGRVVREFEDWWIEHDFPADAAQLTLKLARLAKG